MQTINDANNINGFLTDDILIIISVIGLIIILFLQAYRKYKLDKRINQLANNALELSPEEFMALRRTSLGNSRKYYILTKNFAGVYIIFNKTKDMYYVGQSKTVLNRVNAHFNGKGNGDIYADYKYGDEFTIKMIALNNTEFNNLNELERYMIEKYNAFSKGYNRTCGNKYKK